MMTYNEAIEYIHSVSWKGSRPGLERITELLEGIGDPQDFLSFVHIAGTNGKGSTSAMLESILRDAGYKTGMFVSPYIESFNERIQINGCEIDNTLLAEVTEFVKRAADKMEDKPTEFELITAIGFEAFRRTKCDIVVLEVGMGGRLDSTNVIKNPYLSVITSIALDHTAILGDSIEKIAYEKSGIIKPLCPVVWGGDSPEAEKVIKDFAKRSSSDFHKPQTAQPTDMSPDGITFSLGRYDGLFVPLSGVYQLRNVATVIKAAEILNERGLRILEENIRRGLASVRWKGRFEKLSDMPEVYYDGGHNIEGVSYAAKTVEEYFTKKGIKVNLIFGVMADKDWKDMVGIISPYVEKAFCVFPNNDRSLDKESLAEEFRQNNVEAYIASDFVNAAEMALKCEGVTLALGSLYMYADVKNAVKKVTEKR